MRLGGYPLRYTSLEEEIGNLASELGDKLRNAARPSPHTRAMGENNYDSPIVDSQFLSQTDDAQQVTRASGRDYKHGYDRRPVNEREREREREQEQGAEAEAGEGLALGAGLEPPRSGSEALLPLPPVARALAGQIGDPTGLPTPLSQLPPDKAEQVAPLLGRILAATMLIPGMVVVADTGGCLLSVSGQAAALFGYEPEELVGRPIGVLMPLGTAARHGGYIAAHADGSLGGGTRVHRLNAETAVAKDGTSVTISLDLEAFAGADGKPLLYIGRFGEPRDGDDDGPGDGRGAGVEHPAARRTPPLPLSASHRLSRADVAPRELVCSVVLCSVVGLAELRGQIDAPALFDLVRDIFRRLDAAADAAPGVATVGHAVGDQWMALADGVREPGLGRSERSNTGSGSLGGVSGGSGAEIVSGIGGQGSGSEGGLSCSDPGCPMVIPSGMTVFGGSETGDAGGGGGGGGDGSGHGGGNSACGCARRRSALAAVRLAIDLLEEIARYRSASQLAKLDLRIGIHTGEAVVGLLVPGRTSLSVLGETVTVVQAIEARALPGTMAVSSATVESLPGSVADAFRSLSKDVHVPSTNEKVRAYLGSKSIVADAIERGSGSASTGSRTESSRTTINSNSLTP